MPDWVNDKVKYLLRTTKEFTLSRHLEEHLESPDYKHDYTMDILNKVIHNLKSNFVAPFEVEVNEDKKFITKFVIRTHLNDTTDISIVFGSRGYIRTAWVNDRYDKHYTLDTSKYSKD